MAHQLTGISEEGMIKMKIIATITDCGMAANIGGDPVRVSEIIDIPKNNLPKNLKKYLEDPKWQTLSLSILSDI